MEGGGGREQYLTHVPLPTAGLHVANYNLEWADFVENKNSLRRNMAPLSTCAKVNLVVFFVHLEGGGGRPRSG